MECGEREAAVAHHAENVVMHVSRMTLADDVSVRGPGGFASIPSRTVHAGGRDSMRELAGAARSGGLTRALVAQIA